MDHDGRIDLLVNGTVLGLDADHGVQWVDFDQDGPVDVEVVFPGGWSREVTEVKNVDPAAHVCRPVTVVLAG